MFIWQQSLLASTISRNINSQWDLVASQPVWTGSSITDIKNPAISNSSTQQVVGRFGEPAFGFNASGRRFAISSPAYIIYDDFTIEANIYFDALTPDNQYIMDMGNNGLTFRYYKSSAGGWSLSTGGSTALITGLPEAVQPVVGRWYHWALVRRAGILKLYIEGVEVASLTFTNQLTYNVCTWGCYGGGGSYSLYGRLSQIRVSLFARYTENFVVPDAAYAVSVLEGAYDPFWTANTLLLRVQGGVPVDRTGLNSTVEAVSSPTISTAIQRFGRNTMQFTGGSFYRLANTNNIWNYGTDDFCVECDFYPTVTRASNTYSSLVVRRIFNTSGGFYLGLNGLKPVAFYSTGTTGWSSAIGNVTGTEVPLNAWSTMALVRQGSEIRLYCNGELLGTVAGVTGALATSTLPLTIGASNDNTEPFAGNIGNVRITRGVSRYAGPFTPKVSTEFAERLPNAGELSAADRDVYFNSTVVNIPFAETTREFRQNAVPTVTGTVNIMNTNPIFGRGYVSFATGTNGLTYASARPAISSPNFTVEAHVRTDYAGTAATLAIACQWANSVAGVWIFGIRNNNLAFWSSASIVTYGTSNIADNQWHHLAVSRQGDQLRMFVDGVLQATATINTALNYAGNFGVGLQTTAATAGYTVNIANLMVTNGVARYTAAFTPPTAPRPFVSVAH